MCSPHSFLTAKYVSAYETAGFIFVFGRSAFSAERRLTPALVTLNDAANRLLKLTKEFLT